MRKQLIACGLLVIMVGCNPDALTDTESTGPNQTNGETTPEGTESEGTESEGTESGGTEPKDEETKESLPVLPQISTHFDEIKHTFNAGSESPWFHPRNAKDAYLQQPLLTPHGLNRTPQGLVGLSDVKKALLSHFTIKNVEHSGGLIRVKTSARNNLKKRQGYIVQNWVHLSSHFGEEDTPVYHGGIGSNFAAEGDAQIAADAWSRHFINPVGAQSTDFSFESEFSGSADDANLNDQTLITLSIEHYPLSDAEFSMGPIQASYSSEDISCGLDAEKVNAVLNMSSTNGKIAIDGTFGYDGQDLGTWFLASTDQYSTDLAGKFNLTKGDWQGSYAIKDQWWYSDFLAYSVNLGSCEFILNFTLNLEQIPQENEWQSLVDIDFTQANSLAELPISIAESSNQKQPEITDQGWLELLPNGLEVDAEYQRNVLAKSKLFDLAENVNAVRISYDLDASYVPDSHCGRSAFEVLVKSPQDKDYDDNELTRDLDTIGSDQDYGREVLTDHKKLFLVPDHIEQIEVSMQFITDRCTDSADGSQFRIAIDNFTIEPLEFTPHPLSGPWLLGLDFYGDNCPANSQTEINLTEALGDISVNFENGFSLSGKLEKNGDFLATATNGQRNHLFSRPLTHINKHSMWGGKIDGCHSFLSWKRAPENLL